jgi:plasmid stabilization system protein ParE
MRRVLASRAQVDLDEILDYLELEAGRATALKYALAFDASLERLDSHPAIGTPRPDLGARVRMIVVSPYLLFYENAPEAVVDGRRDISRDLLTR